VFSSLAKQSFFVLFLALQNHFMFLGQNAVFAQISNERLKNQRSKNGMEKIKFVKIDFVTY